MKNRLATCFSLVSASRNPAALSCLIPGTQSVIEGGSLHLNNEYIWLKLSAHLGEAKNLLQNLTT